MPATQCGNKTPTTSQCRWLLDFCDRASQLISSHEVVRGPRFFGCVGKPPYYGTEWAVPLNVPREQFETPGPATASACRFTGASKEGFSRLLDKDCGSRSPADLLSRSCLPAVE